MSIDNDAELYNADDVLKPYEQDELPFGYEKGEKIANSEKELKCWYLENPINKDLVKTMTLRFGPKVEKDFIIVIKAPNFRNFYNLMSYIKIRMGRIEKHVKANG